MDFAYSAVQAPCAGVQALHSATQAPYSFAQAPLSVAQALHPAAQAPVVWQAGVVFY